MKFDFKNDYKGVTLSGVEFCVTEIVTGHQNETMRRFSNNDNTAKLFLLATCLKSLGSKKFNNSTNEGIEECLNYLKGVLVADIDFMLKKTRMHTYPEKNIFEVKVEFIATKDEVDKHTEMHFFNIDSFEEKPFIWVQESEEYKNKGKIPALYNDYNIMLEENAIDRTYVLRGYEVIWSIPTFAQAQRMVNQYQDKLGILLYLYSRNIRGHEESINENIKETNLSAVTNIESWPGDVSNEILGHLRETEGDVDSQITIESTDASKSKKREVVDFLNHPSFFYPSLGI